MTIFEAHAPARNGAITFKVHIKDGRGLVSIPGCPEFVIINENQSVAFDVDALESPDTILRYAARRE